MIDFKQTDQLRKLYSAAIKDDALLGDITKAFCFGFLKDHLGRKLILRPAQMEMVKAALSSKRLVVLAPRGSGKSYGIAVAIVLRLFFLRENEEIALIAPTNKQAKRVFQYVVSFLQGHPELKRLVKGIRHANPAQITLYGGSFIYCVPVSKNDHGENVRGIHPTFCVVDESGFIPDDIFVPNVEPIVVAKSAPFVNITTPGPRDNHVFRYLYDEKTAKRWRRIKYTWRDMLDQGDAYEPAYPIDPDTGINEVEAKLEEWGEDSPDFRREYMCEYDADQSNLFGDRVFEKAFYSLDRFREGAEGEFNVMTIDYGRKHNSTAWATWGLSIDDEGHTTASLIDLQEMIPRGKGYSPNAIRTDIINYMVINKINAIVIDATSFGDSFSADLEDYIYENYEGVHFYKFIFSIGKSDWYYKYKYLLSDKRLRIPRPSKLDDMEESNMMARAIHQHKMLTATISERSGKILISKPRTEHDDLADAMMLITYFIDKNPKFSVDIELSAVSNLSRSQPWRTEITTPRRLSEFDNFKDTGILL